MLRRKVMQQMLTERAERIDLLEQQLDTVQQEKGHLEEQVAALRSREQMIVDALTNAQQAAKKSVQDAETRAATILADAKAEAQHLKTEAAEKSARIIAQAESSAAEYAATLAEYNETVERAAEQAAKNAASYAAFVKSRRLDVPQIVRDAELLGQIPFEKELELPPVDDDPAVLMQNIYRIQNRDIPDVELPKREQAQEAQAAAEETFVRPAPIEAEPEAPQQAPAPQAEEAAPEPEAEQAVPTVEQFYQSVSADDDGMSLDALLDEIIKAGE